MWRLVFYTQQTSVRHCVRILLILLYSSCCVCTEGVQIQCARELKIPKERERIVVVLYLLLLAVANPSKYDVPRATSFVFLLFVYKCVCEFVFFISRIALYCFGASRFQWLSFVVLFVCCVVLSCVVSSPWVPWWAQPFPIVALE